MGSRFALAGEIMGIRHCQTRNGAVGDMTASGIHNGQTASSQTRGGLIPFYDARQLNMFTFHPLTYALLPTCLPTAPACRPLLYTRTYRLAFLYRLLPPPFLPSFLCHCNRALTGTAHCSCRALRTLDVWHFHASTLCIPRTWATKRCLADGARHSLSLRQRPVAWRRHPVAARLTL